MRFFVVFLQDLLQSRAGCLHLCVAGVVSRLIPLLFLTATRLHKDKFASGSFLWLRLSVMVYEHYQNYPAGLCSLVITIRNAISSTITYIPFGAFNF
jgi:hypothetical protein